VTRAGVLDLQGDVEPHLAALVGLGLDPVRVRRPRDLDGLTHLVLPGGESTTLARLLAQVGLDRALVERRRARDLALFGTCAGAILLGRADREPPPRLGLLDARVTRNAYGRQLDSFECPLVLAEPLAGSAREAPAGGGEPPPFPGVFIRAPRFADDVGAGVRVLARAGGAPVLVEADGVLAATFHPELTDDLRVHRYFVGAVRADRGSEAPSPR